MLPATLEALKERIVGNEANQLAAQLPKNLGSICEGEREKTVNTFA